MIGGARGEDEWLEADGLGGFASGTVSGIRTRRYHGLLVVATTPPLGRVLLVAGLEVRLRTAAGAFALSSERWAGGAVAPDGATRIAGFSPEPWPRWRFELPGGIDLEQEIFVRRGAPATVVAWRLAGPSAGATLEVRPFISGRDFHALEREGPHVRLDAELTDMSVIFRPRDGTPGIVVAHGGGAWEHAPLWYRGFFYAEEEARGLDCVEDLASPGVLRLDLAGGEAALVLAPEGTAAPPAAEIRREEAARRRALRTPLARAADAYVVRRGAGKTIIAGYPWFGDWGRDTFIAAPGLLFATGRLEDAREVLLGWAGLVSRGMLPNAFPERGAAPEYNAVDASLFFILAADALRERAARAGRPLPGRDEEALRNASLAILAGYARGTRFGIRMDEDGLLAAGVPGVQLTWMDARVGEHVVTPRVGKPVEVEALWLNALAVAARWSEWWAYRLERGLASFAARFWIEEAGHLCDVVDPDHRRGAADATFRPNQIFAAGGLPLVPISPAQARRVVDAVEARLLTPLGLRTLAPGSPGYAPRYGGGPSERDGAYHQGTAWPWLLAPFVEAWLRARGPSEEAKREARARFLAPLRAHLGTAGIGHVSELADADPPHAPGGAPFQAWSLGALLRIEELLGA
jgi:predicted glycogen debranching enzyme